MRTSTFQIAVLSIFGASIIGGVIVFALYGGVLSSPSSEVTLWGTYPSSLLEDVLKSQSFTEANVAVSYVEKSSDAFEQDLLNALAEGNGPDLVLLPENLILSNLGKLTLIPYGSYSERDFRDTFIDSADVLATRDGILGLPFSVDPLVMYWNRSLYAASGLSEPLKTWEQAPLVAPRLRALSETGSLIRGGLPFGVFANNRNSSSILSLLILQAGAPIVEHFVDQSLGDVYKANVTGERVVSSAGEAALRFFTEFSDPGKPTFSWSSAFPEARQSFLSENLATYFGFASELSSLRAGNPNLNFDVAEIPQPKGRNPATYARMTVIAITKQGASAGAFQAAGALSSAEAAGLFAARANLPPARRDLLSTFPKDAFLVSFWKSALISRTFLDPDREGTVSAMKEAVENINNGRSSVAEASSRLESRIESELSGI
ncbi:MAG: extracellular solute-binding protein [Patescibacteria group bacterium]